MKRILMMIVLALAGAAALADDVSSAQKRAAAEYLAALASGSPQAIAAAIHPKELERLRLGVVATLREEATRGDSRVRARLFGAAMSLADVERLTDASFFAALARRLRFAPGRIYTDFEGVIAARDGKELVHVLVRGEQPSDRGQTRVVEFVSLLPYGRDWKAAVPSSVEAQIEDLIAGRTAAAAPRDAAANGPAAGAPQAGTAAPNVASNSPEILGMLGAAEKALVDGRCDEYYKQYLSPGLRKALSARAIDTLVAGCKNNLGARESLIAALRIVRKLAPRYEYDGTRATYDVTGQGLAFDRFVLEQIEKRWYIAE